MGRLQQRTWTDQNGNTRSTVEVMAEELGAKPSLGDGDHDQDHTQPEPVASSTGDAGRGRSMLASRPFSLNLL